MRLLTALLASTFAVSATAGEAQLLPAGEFAARDGRPGPGKTWRLTDVQGRAIAAALSATAARTKVVIDYDHQTLHAKTNGQKAPASGWILSAEWRDGEGLFAQVDWTDAAKAHIAAREYQYISPVMQYDRDTGQVHGVALAALVNYPALTGMHAAVAQLAAQFDSHDQEQSDMNLLVALATLLALPADATEAAVIAAVTALQKPAPLTAALATALNLQSTADEATALSAIATLKAPKADEAALATVVALQGQVAALTTRLNDDALAKVIADAEAAGKITPATKQVMVDLGRKDMATLSTVIASLPVIPGLAGQSGGRDPGAAGGDAVVTAALATDMQRAFGLTAEQFAKGAAAAAH